MTMPVAEIVASLQEMLDVSRGSATLAQRLAGGSLSVLYEFQAPDAALEPYTLTVAGDERALVAGSVPYDQADIVIRCEPLTLHRLVSGELGGREAIVGGLLDIRRAPSLPKLLLMRSLLNRYKKARQRAAATTPPASFLDDQRT